MRIFIDADGCPVVNETIRLAQKLNIPVTVVKNYAHELQSEYAEIVTVDISRDAADFYIANHLKHEDVLITQDYGLASLILSRKAYGFHQNGWQYREENIETLLMERYEAGKARRSARNHLKGPPRRDKKQNEIFFQRLCAFLEKVKDK